MTLETQVFLDLEETVIESWFNPLLINVSKLRDFFEEKRITEVQIFSFAIHSDHDKDVFVKTMQPQIERALDVKITKVFTVPEIGNIIVKEFGINFELNEILTVWSKQRAFIDVCTAIAPKGSTNVLIDDMVEDISLKNFSKGIVIRTLNVREM